MKKIVIRSVFYLLWLVPIQEKRYTYIQKKQRRPQEMGQFLNSKPSHCIRRTVQGTGWGTRCDLY